MLLRLTLAFCLAFLCEVSVSKPRARELGIPLDGTPGKWNAITDVEGIEVGYVTLIQGKAARAVRTGVTAVLPLGKKSTDLLFAGWHSLNGNGELTGTTWLKESGQLEGPILLTNTHSVGTVRDAVVSWRVKQGRPNDAVSLPLVGETWDGFLNDINGFHVKPEHAIDAIESAKSGTVPEGNVGGGTGMICFEFKCGSGTSSRTVKTPHGSYTLGVFVQSNFGRRHQLQIAGIPIGKAIKSDLVWTKETGSIIGIIATDAPLLPHQLERLARRAGMGIARLGASSGDGSGDLFLAFSTAQKIPKELKKNHSLKMYPNGDLDPLFEATVQAMEEAVLNSLFAAETMSGVEGHQAIALPVETTLSLLKEHRRLSHKDFPQQKRTQSNIGNSP
jgi:D-aminopeptidase